MTHEDIRNAEALILKLGDEDEYLLNSRFQRTCDVIRNFTDQSIVRSLFLKIELFIQFVPGKSNIYASLLSVFQSTHSECIEEIMNSLTEAFKNALDGMDEIVATNIILFLMESVKVGLVNTLAFISVLMDLIHVAETQSGRLKFIVRLIELALPGILGIFTEKYEMEFKNLTDDLGKLLIHKKEKVIGNLHEEILIFEQLKTATPVQITENPFSFMRVSRIEQLSTVKPLRRTFKIIPDVFIDLFGREPKFSPTIKFFKKKIAEIENKEMSLSTFAINSFIHQILYSFRKSPDLLMDKIATYPWNKFGDLKNWIFLENLLHLILLPDHREDNLMLVSKLVSIAIEQHKMQLFFEEAIEELSNYFSENFEHVHFSWIAKVIKVLAFVNFKNKTALVLSTEKFSFSDDLFYFVNIYFAIQSGQLSWKTKAIETEQETKLSN